MQLNVCCEEGAKRRRLVMLLMMMRWRRQLELRVPASFCPSSQQLPLPSCQASGRVCGEVENEWEEERTSSRWSDEAGERQRRDKNDACASASFRSSSQSAGRAR